MQVKNKEYKLITIVIAPENYKDDVGYACSHINTDAEYPHFKFYVSRNVSEDVYPYVYPGNYGLINQHYATLKGLMYSKYDAINFLIPDPREILRHWKQWYEIFRAIPNHIMRKAYVIPCHNYFKLKDILEALEQLALNDTHNSSVSALPIHGLSNNNSSVGLFNYYCQLADEEFNPDGSVKDDVII